MDNGKRLELARRLVDALEEGRDQEAVEILREIDGFRSKALLRHLAELTRDVHQSLLGLSDDPQLVEITRNNMPDARNRLQYVISKTEDSAHRTLAAVEDMMPMAERLVTGATAAVRGGEPAAVQAYVDDAIATAEFLRGGLTEVLMAQEFQDLTGQVIRRTIELVEVVETKLVALITAELTTTTGESSRPAPTGPTGPAMSGDSAAIHHQDDVDALLAELGV